MHLEFGAWGGNGKGKGGLYVLVVLARRKSVMVCIPLSGIFFTTCI
jgi:hypothetical protein